MTMRAIHTAESLSVSFFLNQPNIEVKAGGEEESVKRVGKPAEAVKPQTFMNETCSANGFKHRRANGANGAKA